MALQTMIKKLVDARKAYDEQLASIGAAVGKEIAEYLAPFIPAGYGVRWRQYTPYFNDGEACEFSVHEAYLVPAYRGEDGDIMFGRPPVEGEVAEDEDEYEDSDSGVALGSWGLESYGKQDYNPLIEGFSPEALQALITARNDLPDDMLERAFGDHAHVVILADGTFQRSSYDHD